MKKKTITRILGRTGASIRNKITIYPDFLCRWFARHDIKQVKKIFKELDDDIAFFKKADADINIAKVDGALNRFFGHIYELEDDLGDALRYTFLMEYRALKRAVQVKEAAKKYKGLDGIRQILDGYRRKYSVAKNNLDAAFRSVRDQKIGRERLRDMMLATVIGEYINTRMAVSATKSNEHKVLHHGAVIAGMLKQMDKNKVTEKDIPGFKKKLGKEYEEFGLALQLLVVKASFVERMLTRFREHSRRYFDSFAPQVDRLRKEGFPPGDLSQVNEEFITPYKSLLDDNLEYEFEQVRLMEKMFKDSEI